MKNHKKKSTTLNNYSTGENYPLIKEKYLDDGFIKKPESNIKKIIKKIFNKKEN